MEIIREAPKLSSFVSLSEHQSATPASFYSGAPVLHYHSSRCKVLLPVRDLNVSPAFTALGNHSKADSGTNGTVTNGDLCAEIDDNTAQKEIDEVDVWVTSDKLLLFSVLTAAGCSIPYPTISLHALQSLPLPSAGEQQGLYMQLVPSMSDSTDADEELDSVSLTIIPPLPPQLPSSTGSATGSTDEDQVTPAVALFNALSNCSNLHPDPVEVGDDDEHGMLDSTLFRAGLIAPGSTNGSLPPALPGSGGWITAENVTEYVDEDGNWIGDDEEPQISTTPGPRAGTIRPRDDDANVADDYAESGETKWRRTE